MKHLWHVDAPKIVFEYKYGDKNGRRKAPVICLPNIRRRMVHGKDADYYAYVSRHIVDTIERFPDVFNSLYVSLCILP